VQWANIQTANSFRIYLTKKPEYRRILQIASAVVTNSLGRGLCLVPDIRGIAARLNRTASSEWATISTPAHELANIT
jgi:hypothetical protein